MLANQLKIGDTIGIISPSHVATHDVYDLIVENIKAKGFKVKEGKNIYKNTYGYLSSLDERIEDINDMIEDSDVKLVLFGGGDGGMEVLPYINYEAIKKNPKLFMSYSDGTSMLNAIYAKTGLVVYYGQTQGEFQYPTDYNYSQFEYNLMGERAEKFVPFSKWKVCSEGVGEGIVVGGYSMNFSLMINGPYFNYDKDKKYILIFEDHEAFSGLAKVSGLLSIIEQNDFIKNVAGLVFGHYSYNEYPDLYKRLERFGKKHGVPVVYTKDFGHGNEHAIIPIGAVAKLDTINNSLLFKY